MSNRITPLILAVALFMEMMDSTVISTSLPAIAADIGSEPISLKLALAAYLVALAIFIPISGWMADRYGARNVFRSAIVVFMLGSIACAFADSLFTFVLARFLQGVGGSMMTPLSRLILIRNTPKKDLINAWAWLTVPALFGPLAGPPIGGFLTTYFSWQWIFYINIPIGIIGILLASKYLSGTGHREKRKLDWIGFLLTGSCFSGLIFGLSVISLPALPPIFGVSVAVAGLICGLLYIFHARRVQNPVLDLKVFDEPIFRTATNAGFVFRVAIGGVPFLFPLMLQIGFGYSPFESGMISFIGAAGAILMKFFLKPALGRFGFRTLLIAGVCVSAVLTIAQGFFNAQTPVWIMMSILLFMGFFRSMYFTSLNTLTFTQTTDEHTSSATVLSSVSIQLAFAFGVALTALLLEGLAFVRGVEVGVAEMQIVFFILAAITVVSLLPLFGLSKQVGDDVSGHVAKIPIP
ncbi:DHA2 family efflux MFS transporter permease subunit [Maritalea sp.]|jgi:EmrB/QacA subfamily drug resistance transporter|uniref:DHA2 family efflux MFS transporter permease subunit n=1 Tax=Maritalea sp. TaxID=2003361 RepID=UPI0039E6D62B